MKRYRWSPDCMDAHKDGVYVRFEDADQLRGTLSLAEKGLANYAQENQRMRDLLVVASEALSAFTTTYNGRPSRFAEAERASGEIIMAAGDKVDQFLYPDLYSSEPQEAKQT